MRILVTGSKGFVGSNLCEALKAIRDSKDCRKRYQTFLPLDVMECDRDITTDKLDSYCERAEFVVHLAGVNRPAEGDFSGNIASLGDVLSRLERAKNFAPVLLSSSAQAYLTGHYEGSEYGKSKLGAERILRQYAEAHSTLVYVFRFPNLYGKWCRPHYNSFVATLCDAIANDRDYHVDDPC